MAVLDIAQLDAAPLHRDPFEFVIVDSFVRAAALPALIGGFPVVRQHGSFPLEALRVEEGFARFAAELAGDELRQAIERKFAVDLQDRPTMITVRGRSDGQDGRIHTDSATKIITLLLYLNPAWDASGGRLRLLRDGDDLDAYAAEIAPLAGTMVAFRRSATSFHGHQPHKGERRVLQLNWVTDAAVVRRELGRHRWSARLKALNPFG
jgi:SM-20-related protein